MKAFLKCKMYLLIIVEGENNLMAYCLIITIVFMGALIILVKSRFSCVFNLQYILMIEVYK